MLFAVDRREALQIVIIVGQMRLVGDIDQGIWLKLRIGIVSLRLSAFDATREFSC